MRHSYKDLAACAKDLEERWEKLDGRLFLFCGLRLLKTDGLDDCAAAFLELTNLYRFLHDANPLFRIPVLGKLGYPESLPDDWKFLRHFICHNNDWTQTDQDNKSVRVGEKYFLNGRIDAPKFTKKVDNMIEEACGVVTRFVSWVEELEAAEQRRFLDEWRLETAEWYGSKRDGFEWIRRHVNGMLYLNGIDKTDKTVLDVIYKEAADILIGDLPEEKKQKANATSYKEEDRLRGAIRLFLSHTAESRTDVTLRPDPGPGSVSLIRLIYQFVIDPVILKSKPAVTSSVRPTATHSGGAAAFTATDDELPHVFVTLDAVNETPNAAPTPAQMPTPAQTPEDLFFPGAVYIPDIWDASAAPDEAPAKDDALPGAEPETAAPEQTPEADVPETASQSVRTAVFHPADRDPVGTPKRRILGQIEWDGNRCPAAIFVEDDVLRFADRDYFGDETALLNTIRNRDSLQVALTGDVPKTGAQVIVSLQKTGLTLRELLRDDVPTHRTQTSPPSPEPANVLPDLNKKTVRITMEGTDGKYGVYRAEDKTAYKVRLVGKPPKAQEKRLNTPGTQVEVKITQSEYPDYTATFVKVL